MRFATNLRRTVSVALAGIVLLQAGCGGGKPAKLEVVPTKGKITYKGKPPVGAQIVLLPVKDDSPDGVKPRGRVAEDGTFQLTTYSTSDGKPDGAPPGEYLVSIRWTGANRSAKDDDEGGPPGPPGGVQRDRFGDKYSNPKTSGLKVTVTAGKDLDPIELK